MRARLLAFVEQLRGRGVDVSVTETLDAVRAVAAAGLEREVLRETLAATLVKSEADRPAFDALFDEAFPLVGAGRAVGRRRKRLRGGGGDAPARRSRAGEGERTAADRPAKEPRHARSERPREDARGEVARHHGRRAARVRQLLETPLAHMDAVDVAEARDLVRELGQRLRGRLARRDRRTRRGRLDLRRTIRSSTTTGGVPARLRFRGRRPGRPDLIALCDLSGSVAAASELCLGLIAPASDYFRRVDLFVYVDRLCPVSIEDGHVAPGGPLDLHARSDFGAVLADLWRDHQRRLGRGTIVLVLGDARNNRRPPRVDLLRAIADRVQRIVWLVPEERARWDTGDSVLRLYAPVCDAVVECTDLRTLVAAVRRVL